MTAAPFHCAAVVTDIEGTTGSISFVRDVLFPFAHEHLGAFVAGRRDDPEVARALREAAIAADEPHADEARIVAILRDWIVNDRKITPLKTLQGLIWADGYATGAFEGHVYPDAVDALRRWNAAGFALYVYSSGSIAAQQLLFGHSCAGDLRALFRGYFDTTSGAKDDVAAYRRIAAAIDVTPAALLFVSDRDRELAAARAAGWQVACLARPNEPSDEAHVGFPVFASFDTIVLERAE